MALTLPKALVPPPVSIDLVERGLGLVPIPAAQILLDEGALQVRAANGAYRLAGLGIEADRSPMLAALSTRIIDFLASPEQRREFGWQLGEAIDCRHYRVTLARSDSAFSDRCQAYFVDETARLRTERSLRREMTTDSLTGLPNREGFGDEVEALRLAGGRVAVLVVDLDRFGRLNACLGGVVADELLITVARRIKGVLRARDTLARIGGDAFGIAVAIEQDDDAHHAAKRVARVLADPFRLTDYEIGVEGSIGIAFGEPADQTEEVIRHAQFAVKAAKASGRAEVYQNSAFAIEREQFGIETALRRAIEEQRLRLTYQPICELISGRIVAVEALARWHEDGRDIGPTQFIPVAEESGLIIPLGRWAIEEATRTLAGWDALAGGDCGIGIAVNVSPIQLQRDTLTDVVGGALAAAGLDGGRLKLELTESALVSDPARTAAIMRSLKELGASIAMDDFGTGYSNLAFLQTLPIDVLKIDRSFVTGMLADRDKVAIVRAILGLAQALGMTTIAEGVESHGVVQTLAAMGCAMGQGYFYARPLEADEAWAMIAAARGA